METPGILHFRFPGGQVITRPVQIIGVRPEDRAKTGDFGEFLVDDKNQRIEPSFKVDEKFKEQTTAGELLKDFPADSNDPFTIKMREELLKQRDEQAPDEGTIVGYAIATHHRGKNLPDHFIAPPGTKVGLLFPVAGKSKSEGGFDTFTVVGYFKSGMSEYDSTHVYVPLRRLQEQRRLIDLNQRGAVNQIQIKVRPGASLDELAEKIQISWMSSIPRSFACPPGSRSKGLFWERSRSSRASSTSCSSSSSPWPASASWPFSR